MNVTALQIACRNLMFCDGGHHVQGYPRTHNLSLATDGDDEMVVKPLGQEMANEAR